MLKAEMAPCFLIAMLLIPAPTVADVASELVRCQLEAARSYPAPSNKGAQNWPERAANLHKRAENIETCMRRAGYSVTAECSVLLKTYESCMKIADKLMHGPTGSQYRDADWNRIVWIMNGTCGPRSGYRQIAISPAVGGPAGWAGNMVGRCAFGGPALTARNHIQSAANQQRFQRKRLLLISS
jgi:hypothetical protein